MRRDGWIVQRRRDVLYTNEQSQSKITRALTKLQRKNVMWLSYHNEIVYLKSSFWSLCIPLSLAWGRKNGRLFCIVLNDATQKRRLESRLESGLTICSLASPLHLHFAYWICKDGNHQETCRSKRQFELAKCFGLKRSKVVAYISRSPRLSTWCIQNRSVKMNSHHNAKRVWRGNHLQVRQ